MIEIKVSLIDGIDRQEFADSFADQESIYTRYLCPDVPTDLRMSIKKSYLDLFTSDSRVSNVEHLKFKSSGHLPLTIPPLQYQQGTVVTRDNIPFRPNNNDRPGYPGDVPSNQKKNWLGSHFMPFSTYIDSGVAGPNRNQNPFVTRQPIGTHVDDFSSKSEYGHTTNPSVDSPSGIQYTSRFFGKYVDIVAIEAGKNPLAMYEDGFYLDEAEAADVYHPDYGTVNETNPNIVQNDPINNGDAPNGAYTIEGTRITLRDWVGPASEGTNTGHLLALKSRFENQNLNAGQRCPLHAHVMGTLSVSGGLVGGFAKKANLYPMFTYDANDTGSDQDDAAYCVDLVTEWHKNKENNPNTGQPNPTIIVNEWHYPEQTSFLTPVDNIKNIYNARTDTLTQRPANGWGSNLQPFVDAHFIPYRIEDSENLGTFYWAVATGRGGDPDFGENLDQKEAIERAWKAGVVVVTTAGNGTEIFAKRDDAEFNSYYTIDDNSWSLRSSFEGKRIARYDRVPSGVGRKVYPLRCYGPSGGKRDHEIVVAAGQNSETHPILDDYSSRGPGIDIIGRGSGTWSASTIGKLGRTVYTPKPDNSIGSTWPLDPTDTEYTSGALSSSGYIFKKDDRLIIESLGSGTDTQNQDRWNTYLGTLNTPAGDFIPNSLYKITNLGSGTDTQNQDRWNTYLDRSSLSGGRLVPNTRYEIVTLGTLSDAENQENWNRYLNTENQQYSVGDTFKATTTGSRISTATVKGAYVVGDTFSKPLKTSRMGEEFDVWDLPYRFDENLVGTYDSVYETFTGVSNGALQVPNVDTDTLVTPSVNDLVFLRKQTQEDSTGVYKVTTVGNSSTPFVLTRTSHKDYRNGGYQVLGATASRVYKVGEVFRHPPTTSNNPAGATVTAGSWGWRYFGGTSCAGPTVAGKIACAMEEFLHKYGTWPTNNQAKDILISTATVVNDDAPATDWGNVPAPAFGKNTTGVDQYTSNPKNDSALASSLNAAPNNLFSTTSGTVKPDFTGWTSTSYPATNLRLYTIYTIFRNRRHHYSTNGNWLRYEY